MKTPHYLQPTTRVFNHNHCHDVKRDEAGLVVLVPADIDVHSVALRRNALKAEVGRLAEMSRTRDA